MSLHHILSIMFYCIFDVVLAVFSQTYRDASGYDHTNFYHLGKLVKACVLESGCKITDSHVTSFYHGISEALLFPEIIGEAGVGIKIYCPFSTSSKMEVALNFASVNNNGMIIEFRNEASNARCFSTAWLSDYPQESEYLFIQNEYELRIHNIIDTMDGATFGPIIKVLHVIDELVSENYLEEFVCGYTKSLIIKTVHYQLSKHHFSSQQYTPWKIHPYAKALIDAYFNNKKSVKLNISVLKQEYDYFIDIFYSQNKGIAID
eukprot:126583_1